MTCCIGLMEPSANLCEACYLLIFCVSLSCPFEHVGYGSWQYVASKAIAAHWNSLQSSHLLLCLFEGQTISHLCDEVGSLIELMFKGCELGPASLHLGLQAALLRRFSSLLCTKVLRAMPPSFSCGLLSCVKLCVKPCSLLVSVVCLLIGLVTALTCLRVCRTGRFQKPL